MRPVQNSVRHHLAHLTPSQIYHSLPIFPNIPENSMAKYPNQIDQPTWKKRCFRPGSFSSTSGNNAKKPSDIIRKQQTEKSLILFSDGTSLQRITASNGDKNKNTEGEPRMPCKG